MFQNGYSLFLLYAQVKLFIYSFRWTFISLIIRANFIMITKLVNVIIIKLREY